MRYCDSRGIDSLWRPENVIDDAHQRLFTDASWSGSAADAAKNNVSNLSSDNSTLQSSLNQIGQTLVTYGTAIKLVEKKVYPTPIPGSRDPEAAADLVYAGAASVAAAAGIGDAMIKMVPIATKNGKKPPNQVGSPLAKPPSIPSQKFPSTPPSHLAHVPGLPVAPPANTGVVPISPGLRPPAMNGFVPVVAGPLAGALMPEAFAEPVGGAGAVPGEDVVAESAGPGEGAAAEEGVPIMPVGGAAANGDDCRRRRASFMDDRSFWKEGVEQASPGLIGSA